MKTNTKRVALVSGFALIASIVAGAANARPPYEAYYNYYSSATYQHVVGSLSISCDGERTQSGQVTNYRREIYRGSCL